MMDNTDGLPLHNPPSDQQRHPQRHQVDECDHIYEQHQQNAAIAQVEVIATSEAANATEVWVENQAAVLAHNAEMAPAPFVTGTTTTAPLTAVETTFLANSSFDINNKKAKPNKRPRAKPGFGSRTSRTTIVETGQKRRSCICANSKKCNELMMKWAKVSPSDYHCKLYVIACVPI